jgi:Glycosyl transferase family 2
MAVSPRITLVTEAYNLAEGQSEAAFLRALRAVSEISARRNDVEVIVLDPSDQNLARPILAERFPQFVALHVPGMSYDGQKNHAAIRGRGTYLVFLDGDCVPVRNDWLDEITRPFDNPNVHGVGGLTLYDDFSLTGKAMSILDFGFLFEARRGQPLGCYASNNVAFRRESYLRLPAPDDGILRSYCYKHAQMMLRAQIPVMSNPNAFVLHELPDIEKERLRRGYDYVAALWSDPELDLAADLADTPEFAAKVLKVNLEYAVSRMLAAPLELGLTLADRHNLAAEFDRLMKIDAQGLALAQREGALNGRNARARELHHTLKMGAGLSPGSMDRAKTGN